MVSLDFISVFISFKFQKNAAFIRNQINFLLLHWKLNYLFLLLLFY